MKLTIRPYFLEFKRPFTLAHGTRKGTQLAFVKIEHNGVTAFGEASLPPYRKETLETVEKWVLSQKGQVAELLADDPFEARERMPYSASNTSASNALQSAVLHCYAKSRNKTLADFFPDQQANPQLSLTFTKDDIPFLEEKLSIAKHFTLLKLKLTGTEDDLSFVKRIIKESDQEFCVDYNQAFSKREDAIKQISELEQLECRLVEQPLHEEDHDGHYWLKERISMPIVADESICTREDLEQYHEAYSGVNIKLMKSGGLFQAEEMFRSETPGGFLKLVGCMSESTLGVATAAVLARQAEIADLDAPYLNKNDPFTGFQIIDQKIQLGEIVLRDSEKLNLQ